MSALAEIDETALAMQAGGMTRRAAVRQLIADVIDKVRAMPGSLGEDPFPLKHTFADGVYLRQIFIPADSITVGKIHKTRHAVFLSVGEVEVLTENGVERIVGPAIFISEPGTQRVVYAIRDTLWTNVHATTLTDPKAIEEQIIAKTYEELPCLLD